MRAPREVSFWEALRFWCKLGFISFGGPAGQIAVMHRELVEQRRWISERRFLHALNYCMLLPGPEAQQLAVYIGWLLHRTLGGVVAGVLFILPSLFILIGLSWVYLSYGQVGWVAGLLYGIKPAVAALVLHAVHRMGAKTLRNPRRAPLLWGIATSSFVALALFAVPFPLVVLCAAFVGWLVGRWAPSQITTGASGHLVQAVDTALPPAVIDDDTPTPEHARFKRSRFLRVLGTGAALWIASMGMLVVWQGWSGTLATMGWFFTKAALLTFGGAYAVLPYVYQGAVVEHGWLLGPQMIDGLALGESTPGPLIMVVAFVGFLGGWGQQVLGAQALFAGASLAAMVVTWFTFLPSFVFILAGGPFVESTHGKLHFTAPLTGITAAVVGVVASLALFFLLHVAYPSGWSAENWASPDWVGLILVVIAALALIVFKQGVVRVILASALIGWMWQSTSMV